MRNAVNVPNFIPIGKKTNLYQDYECSSDFENDSENECDPFELMS